MDIVVAEDINRVIKSLFFISRVYICVWVYVCVNKAKTKPGVVPFYPIERYKAKTKPGVVTACPIERYKTKPGVDDNCHPAITTTTINITTTITITITITIIITITI